MHPECIQLLREGGIDMRDVAGVFTNRDSAQRAIDELIRAGINAERIIFLSGEKSGAELSAVPTTDTERDGMGKAIGTVVGGVTGASAGLGLGSGIASLFVPGVGPILAAGLGAAALLGIGGAAVGAKTGDRSEHDLDIGVPRDDMELYRELMRQGRSLVVVETSSDEELSNVRSILQKYQGEDFDQVRERFGRAA
jgi:hypothetical protein